MLLIYCQRVALESALSHLDVKMIQNICLELSKLVNVKLPHQVCREVGIYSNLMTYINMFAGYRDA